MKAPLAAGALFGAPFLCVACGKTQAAARRGWDLIPVVVAVQDVAAGEILSSAMIAQRPMPSQFVTASVVKPENYNAVVGQVCRFGLAKGDLVLWSAFAPRTAASPAGPPPGPGGAAEAVPARWLSDLRAADGRPLGAFDREQKRNLGGVAVDFVEASGARADGAKVPARLLGAVAGDSTGSFSLELIGPPAAVGKVQGDFAALAAAMARGSR